MAFLCEPTAYQVIARSDAMGNVLNSSFRSINPVTGEVTLIKNNMGAIVNAIGYNPLDNFIYGIYDSNDPRAGNLARIDEFGNVTDLGPIPNLNNTNLTNGTFDENGYFYLKRQSQDFYYTVDLNPASPNFGILVDPTTGYTVAGPPYYTDIVPAVGSGSGDWIYNSNDGLLYTTIDSGDFVTIDPTTGASNIIPTEAGFPATYGGMFNDASGIIYALNNSTGDIIRWINTGGFMDGELFSTSLPATRQDATMCLNASILLDFGDAPDTSSGTGTDDYKTLLASDGPRHFIRNDLRLGGTITSEIDAYQNATATGDDLINGVQDDGINAPIPEYLEGQDYMVMLYYSNNTLENANIYAWLDFNKNGVFELEEAAEPIVVSSNILNPREVTLKFNRPISSNLVAGDSTFMRIRITTDELINLNNNLTAEDTRSIGPAPDGEVEDYMVEVISLEINGLVWYDLNCNGIRDPLEPLAEGITVQLYSEDDLENPIMFTTTDSLGEYVFQNLDQGVYYIKVILEDGYLFTIANVGSDDTIDSDVDKTSGFSERLNLTRNNSSITVDAGLCKKNIISGVAFYDCNSDGIFNDADKRLCGVLVSLINEDGVTIESVYTNCDGEYEFDCLEPRTYTVKVIEPPSMSYSIQNLGEYYGSKPDSTTGEFDVSLINTDYLEGYSGFTGSLTLNMKYCDKCKNNYFCSFDSGCNCNSGNHCRRKGVR